MTKTFDIECYHLANHFLDDYTKVTETERVELACAIQRTIEGWLEDRDNAAEAAYGAHIDAQIDERRMGERA